MQSVFDFGVLNIFLILFFKLFTFFVVFSFIFSLFFSLSFNSCSKKKLVLLNNETDSSILKVDTEEENEDIEFILL